MLCHYQKCEFSNGFSREDILNSHKFFSRSVLLLFYCIPNQKSALMKLLPFGQKIPKVLRIFLQKTPTVLFILWFSSLNLANCTRILSITVPGLVGSTKCEFYDDILNFVCVFRHFTCFSEFTFHKVFLVVI